MSISVTGVRVRSLMTWPLAVVSMDDTMRDVATELATQEVGALIVVGPYDNPVGLVSERDVVRNLAAGARPDQVLARDLMSTPVLVADGDDPVEAVARQMLDSGVRHLPVGTGDEIRGMVSIRDVLNAVTSR